jgi:hypothetical protein
MSSPRTISRGGAVCADAVLALANRSRIGSFFIRKAFHREDAKARHG